MVIVFLYWNFSIFFRTIENWYNLSLVFVFVLWILIREKFAGKGNFSQNWIKYNRVDRYVIQCTYTSLKFENIISVLKCRWGERVQLLVFRPSFFKIRTIDRESKFILYIETGEVRGFPFFGIYMYMVRVLMFLLKISVFQPHYSRSRLEKVVFEQVFLFITFVACKSPF